MNQTEPPSSRSRIAFVQACWHRTIVESGRDGFLRELERLGVSPDRIDVFEVPGSLEIPLHVKLLAKSGRYSAVVAAGFVVDGGIYRHEFVAQAVIDGLMSVQLETEVPVLSMVLTPQRFHEHDEHVAFFTGHMTKKGAEAAAACVHTMRCMEAIEPSAAEAVETVGRISAV
ncbi:MAG: 6,7-dimethyl-8-ribityllumazine synthase [Chromatiales bacterium]|nr:6,7-dimethyl-8-ribityllumazine synthase [Chromatiales bacterium]